MAKVLDQPRFKCALAAMQTIQSIPGAIPVLHAGPGCASKLNDNSGSSGHYAANVYPCSLVSEKEVVFGGIKKLRNTIENSLKVIDADLFIVLSGCTTEIIGDDIQEVVEEFSDSEKPVIWAKTPGFKGNNYLGHDWILKALFEQYLKTLPPAPKIKGLVNIFAGTPEQDPFWLGNLRELERLIQSIGLTPNTIFGFGRSIENIKKLKQAEYTVLVSPWQGSESAEYLEKKYDIPLLKYPILPIGAAETSKFLRAVGEFCHADNELVEKVIKENEAEFFYYIERFAETFLEPQLVGKRFTVVSEAQYALGITRFLVNDMGEFPLTIFITDDTPEKYRDSIRTELNKLNYDIQAEVEWNVDGNEIYKKIKDFDFGGIPLVIGSTWEKKVARELGAHFVNVSYPVLDRFVINSSIVGYAGGLKLLEDIYSDSFYNSTL
ncbi:Nitrogenase molybdenum-iron protein, alpha and beta chain [Treponema sp. JC4]|uniref:nitrogenase component 1 n=1 Tax=Treponema sp. JC4 TaxID=1124982 RepID=UPI00025AFB96|nr:nitrogenase component 1 [Treponema sp. JC4]EID85835.1 Nitrogenase molybdenum-iron protein, alpha and beta chain [Treponema sp. JC4]